MLELQSELQQTETKLTELQSKRNDQTSLMLTPEQEQELKRFTAEKARVRKELRETQRGLDVDINRLDNWLKVINIALAPLAVAIAGAFILSMRRRRKSCGSADHHDARTLYAAPGRGAGGHLRRDLSELAAQLAEGHARRCRSSRRSPPSSTPSAR